MIQVISSQERHHEDLGWLDTRWHFSFSDYQDPSNVNWGALRVFNDDVIRSGGFDMHPHRDMEIVTYVLDGELEHRDHLGNRGVIHGGEVQVMSAGRGIMHAEFNHSQEKPVHLLQLWILPRHRNNPPRWEQRQFTQEQRQGRLLPVVSGGEIPGTLKIDQDAAIYVASLSAKQSVAYDAKPLRRLYLFVIKGQLKVNGMDLSAGDQARIADEKHLEVNSLQDSELILLDLPEMG